MDKDRSTEMSHDLTRFASRYWAGEAEVARTFFAEKRTEEEHLRWLGLQANKELQPREGGIIEKLITKLSDDFPHLEKTASRDDFLYTMQFLMEEFRHYKLFADVIDYITGRRLTMDELVNYDLPEDRVLRQVRADYAAKHGDLARFASSFCEGGGASIYYEGMLLKGSELNDRIAAACKSVYDDEVDHAVHGASDLTALAKTDEDWQLAKEMVEAISKQRVKMRNEQFGSPLSDARLAEIAEGKIELPDRFVALLV